MTRAAATPPLDAASVDQPSHREMGVKQYEECGPKQAQKLAQHTSTTDTAATSKRQGRSISFTGNLTLRGSGRFLSGFRKVLEKMLPKSSADRLFLPSKDALLDEAIEGQETTSGHVRLKEGVEAKTGNGLPGVCPRPKRPRATIAETTSNCPITSGDKVSPTPLEKGTSRQRSKQNGSLPILATIQETLPNPAPASPSKSPLKPVRRTLSSGRSREKSKDRRTSASDSTSKPDYKKGRVDEAPEPKVQESRKTYEPQDARPPQKLKIRRPTSAAREISHSTVLEAWTDGAIDDMRQFFADQRLKIHSIAQRLETSCEPMKGKAAEMTQSAVQLSQQAAQMSQQASQMQREAFMLREQASEAQKSASVMGTEALQSLSTFQNQAEAQITAIERAMALPVRKRYSR